MERLRERKRQVEGSLEQRRAATRFEPTAETSDVDASILDSPQQAAESKPRSSGGPQMAPGQKEEDDYTTRLLKAKKQARGDQASGDQNS